MAHTEVEKYSKHCFLTAARKLVPALQEHHLVPTSKAGIRPQLINVKTKKIEMDYIFERTNNSMHVLNTISPAFTSSFAFAEMIVDQSQATSCNHVNFIFDIKRHEVPRNQLMGGSEWAMAKKDFDVRQVVMHICRFTKN